MAQTITYRGQEYPVIPVLVDAVEELKSRRAKGEKDIGLLDISFFSGQWGYIIVVAERPDREDERST